MCSICLQNFAVLTRQHCSLEIWQLKQEKYFSTPKTVSEQKIQITLSNLYGRFYWAVMSQCKTQNTFLICKSSSFTRKVVRAELENPAMISRIDFCGTNRICASENPRNIFPMNIQDIQFSGSVFQSLVDPPGWSTARSPGWWGTGRLLL